jgi:uncharacterized protein (DUF2062 family)
MRRLLQSPRVQLAQEKILSWLKCGISPRRLAFTLALGFAIGCIPVLGVTTALCALLAMVLGLNMPAIQAANWLAMPLQVVLLIPFLRLGQWLFPAQSIAFTRDEILTRIQAAPWQAVVQMGGLFGHGLLAWLITAAPLLLVMTFLLTPLMHWVGKRMADQQTLAD